MRFYGICSGVASGGQREVINCMTGEVYRCGQFLRTNGSYLFEVVADGLVMALFSGGNKASKAVRIIIEDILEPSDL